MGKVNWTTENNPFGYCVVCKNDKCEIRSNRHTAGCKDCQKESAGVSVGARK
jgi:hypothetical protein